MADRASRVMHSKPTRRVSRSRAAQNEPPFSKAIGFEGEANGVCCHLCVGREDAGGADADDHRREQERRGPVLPVVGQLHTQGLKSLI